MLPYAGGAIVLFMILFGIYVRSVPPAEPKLDNSQPQFQGSVPDFMNVDTEPMVKEALDEAAEVLKNLEKEGGEGEAPPQGENVETIEL